MTKCFDKPENNTAYGKAVMESIQVQPSFQVNIPFLYYTQNESSRCNLKKNILVLPRQNQQVPIASLPGRSGPNSSEGLVRNYYLQSKTWDFEANMGRNACPDPGQVVVCISTDSFLSLTTALRSSVGASKRVTSNVGLGFGRYTGFFKFFNLAVHD